MGCRSNKEKRSDRKANNVSAAGLRSQITFSFRLFPVTARRVRLKPLFQFDGCHMYLLSCRYSWSAWLGSSSPPDVLPGAIPC